MDVAVSIEQAERLALLQHLDVVIGQRGGGNNVALIILPIDIFHESLSHRFLIDQLNQPPREAVSRKVAPMPDTPVDSPNRSVTQPNMLIPLIAAVIAPVL